MKMHSLFTKKLNKIFLCKRTTNETDQGLHLLPVMSLSQNKVQCFKCTLLKIKLHEKKPVIMVSITKEKYIDEIKSKMSMNYSTTTTTSHDVYSDSLIVIGNFLSDSAVAKIDEQ